MGLWTNFKQCLMDKDDSLSRGIWTSFKECLKDEDYGDSRGLWSAFMALLKDKDEAEVEEMVNQMVDSNRKSSNNAESRGFWTNLLMKLVSDKDDAESRWGFSFGIGFDKLADTLLEDVDEAKAEAIIKEFVAKNSAAESRAFWVPLLGSVIASMFDKDDAQSRGLWTNFKNCLKDKDDSLSRGIWTDFKACLKDQDIAESRWGFSLGFSWDKLVDNLLQRTIIKMMLSQDGDSIWVLVGTNW